MIQCPKCLSAQVTSEDNENFCLQCHHWWIEPLVKGGQGRSGQAVEDSAWVVVWCFGGIIVLTVLLWIFS